MREIDPAFLDSQEIISAVLACGRFGLAGAFRCELTAKCDPLLKGLQFPQHVGLFVHGFSPTGASISNAERRFQLRHLRTFGKSNSGGRADPSVRRLHRVQVMIRTRFDRRGKCSSISTGSAARCSLTATRTATLGRRDVGYVPRSRGHYIENTGNSDLVFLEMFRSSYYSSISFSEWLGHLPPEPAKTYFSFSDDTLKAFPKDKTTVIGV